MQAFRFVAEKFLPIALFFAIAPWQWIKGLTDVICNAFDRDIMIDINGRASLCFNKRFGTEAPLKNGELANFWRGRGELRERMRHCNRFCGISHSVRAESCTLAGNDKATSFLNESLVSPV